MAFEPLLTTTITRAVALHLNKYLINNNLDESPKPAYKIAHRTETALVRVKYYIMMSIEHSQRVCVHGILSDIQFLLSIVPKVQFLVLWFSQCIPVLLGSLRSDMPSPHGVKSLKTSALQKGASSITCNGSVDTLGATFDGHINV